MSREREATETPTDPLAEARCPIRFRPRTKVFALPVRIALPVRFRSRPEESGTARSFAEKLRQSPHWSDVCTIP
jgi:hypothetical protein